MGLVVSNLPARQETQKKWVRSLGREDPLEEGTATHCSILAWRIPRTEEPGGLQSVGLQRRQDWSHLARTLSVDPGSYFSFSTAGEARWLHAALPVLSSVLPGQEFVFNFYSALSTPFSLFY